MTVVQRIRLMVLFFLWWVACYVIVQKVTTHFPVAHPTLVLPGEPGIPFLPEWLFVYASLYAVLPLMYLSFSKRDEVLKIISAFGVCSIMHFVLFLLMPVHYVLRPEISLLNQGLIHKAVLLIYSIDEPLNNFPSMHVSFAFLMYFSFCAFRPKNSLAVLLFALFVSISTVLVKQHYILDVISAIVLSYVVYVIVLKQRSVVSSGT